MKLLPVSSCWVVTEGLVGLCHQAIGLAQALGVPFVVKEISKPQKWWRLLPPYYWPTPEVDLLKNGAWPDLLISCGRCSVATALAIRKASHGQTFTVHIQHPNVYPQEFDVVIVPEHDRLQGANVLATKGALHHVNRQKLTSGAEHFRPLLASLPPPVISVLIGGKNQHQDFSAAVASDLASKLVAAVKKTHGSLAVTFSRRTSLENEKIFRQSFKDIPAYIWDGAGENPYFGLLSLADVIVTTSDSVSMVSEACFTGKPVYVYELPGGSPRHRQFRQSLLKDGIIRIFTGEIQYWQYNPLDETQRAAHFVVERFLTRLNRKDHTLGNYPCSTQSPQR